jgi:hypothetical protein
MVISVLEKGNLMYVWGTGFFYISICNSKSNILRITNPSAACS